MKRYVIFIALLIATTASAQIPINPGSGGGGGGGSGNAVATVTFHGLPGAVYFNGAMDNNVTANLTDTTNSPFTSANVGNLICVDGSASGGVDTCGTISSVTSSSVAVVSFNNASGAAISGKEYAFGPDNTSALATFTAALAAGGGGVTGGGAKSGVNAIIPAGYYAVSSGFIKLPSDRTTVITGAGSGALSLVANSGNGNPVPDAMPGTMFMILTHTAGAGAFIQAINSSGTSTYEALNRIQDFAVMGGVGLPLHQNGGCSTCDGMQIINFSDILVYNMTFEGMGRRGIYIDSAVNGTQLTNNVNLAEMTHDLVFSNRENGIRIGGNAYGPANPDNFQLEDIAIDGQSFIGSNGDNGVQVFSNIKGFTMRDSGAQGNHNSSDSFPAVQGEISIEGSIHGGVIEPNYVECDHAIISGIAVRVATSPPASLVDQLSIIGNSVISVSGACFYHLEIGTNQATSIIEGVTAESNFLDGAPDTGAGGACFGGAGSDVTDRGTWNWCANSGAFVTLPVAYPISSSGYGCGSLSEGQEAIQTNSTAACAAGTTMTTAGTTHCQVYCNGTAWIQTGR